MESIKASSKGQMVIPKPIRDALDIKSGTALNVELVAGEGFKVTVKPTDRIAAVNRLAGSLAHRAKRMTPAEEDAAFTAAIKADDDRTRRTGRRR
ncbi:MAG: AbrB/MazE/SpoVT family DNA-binding domain-containing protein [Betaproteobacteria bacterium]|nr:AbrB/MazE/SpoVT family DNA-binding domain-containing protein [Betaproteobacteria bacterium]